jgi:hypothetical protein
MLILILRNGVIMTMTVLWWWQCHGILKGSLTFGETCRYKWNDTMSGICFKQLVGVGVFTDKSRLATSWSLWKLSDEYLKTYCDFIYIYIYIYVHIYLRYNRIVLFKKEKSREEHRTFMQWKRKSCEWHGSLVRAVTTIAIFCHERRQSKNEIHPWGRSRLKESQKGPVYSE